MVHFWQISHFVWPTVLSALCGALRDLVAFVQFTSCRLQPATLLKVTFLYGCFSRFLNCAHCTKLRNAPHVVFQRPALMCWTQLNNKVNVSLDQNHLKPVNVTRINRIVQQHFFFTLFNFSRRSLKPLTFPNSRG